MALKKYIDGAWQDVTTLKRHNGSDWQDCDSAKKHDGSNWVDVWSKGIYLYNQGDECKDITGNWDPYDYASLTKYDTYMRVNNEGSYRVSLGTRRQGKWDGPLAQARKKSTILHIDGSALNVYDSTLWVTGYDFNGNYQTKQYIPLTRIDAMYYKIDVDVDAEDFWYSEHTFGLDYIVISLDSKKRLTSSTYMQIDKVYFK